MRLSCTEATAAAAAAAVRATVAPPEDVAGAVAEIVAAVRERGDDAVLELEQRFGGGGPLRVAPDELEAAVDGLDPAVYEGLEVAIANVRAVAEAGRDAEAAAALPAGPDRAAARGAGAARRDLRARAAATRTRRRSSWARSRRGRPASTRSSSPLRRTR